MCDNTVIIIGAGLGGLMSGALLAKEGYRVTVVEKNKNVGGGLQSYRKFGTVFDTGMHIFGGMETNGNIRKICKHLDILDKFEILNLNKGCNAEIYIGAEQKNYSVSFESSSLVDTFSRYFPEEHDNLEKYKEAIHRIINELDLFYLRPKDNKSLGWSEDSVIPANLFISKYVKDEKLQSLLSVVNVLYAGEPDITPAFLHTAIAMILMNGACRVVGGYSTFANALVECIEANGGKLIVGEKVTQICTKSGHATGVCTNKGQMFSGEYVISSLPLLTTIDIIEDSSALSRTYKTSIENKTPSLSAFIINIKLKKNSLKFSNRIGYYLEDYN